MSLKEFPAELAVASWFPTLGLCFTANHVNKSCFLGTSAYSIQWQIHLHNYKWHVTPFYMFNNDSIIFITQVKLGHDKCHKFVKDDVTFQIFPRYPIKTVSYLSMSDASKTSFKTTVILFLGNVLIYL